MGLYMRDELIEDHGKPLDNLLDVTLLKGDPSRMVQVGYDLDKVTKEWLTNFLKKNDDVFAWFAVDMPGIDLDIMVYKLNMTQHTTQ